jgi:hypothetical protein
MTTPPDQDDDGGGLQTFLEELSRLQEVSRQQADELQRAQQAEEVLQREVEAAVLAVHTERQATLQLELDQVKAEVCLVNSRAQTAQQKALLEEIDRQLASTKHCSETVSCESTDGDGGGHTHPLASPSIPSHLSFLHCVSQNAHLSAVYLRPLSSVLHQLHLTFLQEQERRHRQPIGVPLHADRTSESFEVVLQWLSSVVKNMTFTDEERIIMRFAQREKCK